MLHSDASFRLPRALPLAGLMLLMLLLGYLIGRTVSGHVAHVPETVLREDGRAAVPVVILEGVRDGNVVGKMQGDVRLWIGASQVVPNAEGGFAVDPGPLLVNDISVLVPEGMEFVASRRGKKYYGVRSAEGQAIVPENRMYFRSAEEAQTAGFMP